jgi:hypothetical protein
VLEPIISDQENSDEQLVIEKLRAELVNIQPTRRKRVIEKFFLAALGSIPWIGGFLSTAATYKTEEGSLRQDSLQTQWLEEHQKKITLLHGTLEEIQQRFEALDTIIEERIQSEEYLTLVRQGFRTWDEAATVEKRHYIANILINSAGTRACSDDVVRLFIDWIELYHEMHFAVIRAIFQNPGATRYEIWLNLYGTMPREDSAEADLFKLLIRELTVGGVTRQERNVNQLGQFEKRKPHRTRRSAPSSVMESAFEDSKPYVLTELGKQFVHYTMNEAVMRITATESSSDDNTVVY